MNISKVQLISDNGVNEMKRNESCYFFHDASVEISQDMRVLIKAEKMPLKHVKIYFENNNINKNFKILSGAWERAYGDLGWFPADENKILPWFFSACNGEEVRCFGVETAPNALCSWQVKKEYIILNIDIRNGSSAIVLNGKTLETCKIVIAKFEGDLHNAVHGFYKMLCKKPRLPQRLVYGGNDWYCCYGENSFETTVKLTKKIVECAPKNAPKPYVVIDDGWELYFKRPCNTGPWHLCNNKFKDMKKTAEKICEMGAIPGIWFRPLTTVENFAENDRLRTDREEITLDPSSPIVIKYLTAEIETIKNWGYKLIKHDFSTWDIFGTWGKNFENAKEISFSDKTKTTAQIIKNFYKTIRAAAGDDITIIGCNTIGHLGAGIFEIQRTGDDTSGIEWSCTRDMGVNTLAYTLPQHGAFYAIDADCVGITEKIEWKVNKNWLDVLSKSGTPLFVSVDDHAYNDEIKNDITKAFEFACSTQNFSRADDWFENVLPTKWESNFGTTEYNWYRS